jgi:Protein of unknown function (DUF4232)
MQGLPGMQMLDDTGVDLPTDVQHGASPQVPSIPVHKVVLDPAGGASFIFGYSTVPSGSQACPTSAKVRIVPPGQSGSITVTFGMNPCGGTVTVSPVRSATTLPSA